MSPLTDRYAVFGSEHSHSFDVFISDVSGDDQNGGIRVTQLIGAVHLTDGPALIREALTKRKNVYDNDKVYSNLTFSTCEAGLPGGAPDSFREWKSNNVTLVI